MYWSACMNHPRLGFLRESFYDSNAVISMNHIDWILGAGHGNRSEKCSWMALGAKQTAKSYDADRCVNGNRQTDLLTELCLNHSLILEKESHCRDLGDCALDDNKSRIAVWLGEGSCTVANCRTKNLLIQVKQSQG